MIYKVLHVFVNAFSKLFYLQIDRACRYTYCTNYKHKKYPISLIESNRKKEVIYKTKKVSDDEIRSACDLVNQGGQLSLVLTEERLRETYFLVVVVSEGDVIAVSCIKKHHKVAEIGYTAVCPKYRRQGIGRAMTKLLIEHAQTHEILMICGIVYKSNTANQAKLDKLGFFKASEFLSKSGDKTLYWYCHPLLQTNSKAKLMMEDFLIERDRKRSVIN